MARHTVITSPFLFKGILLIIVHISKYTILSRLHTYITFLLIQLSSVTMRSYIILDGFHVLPPNKENERDMMVCWVFVTSPGSVKSAFQWQTSESTCSCSWSMGRQPSCSSVLLRELWLMALPLRLWELPDKIYIKIKILSGFWSQVLLRWLREKPVNLYIIFISKKKKEAFMTNHAQTFRKYGEVQRLSDLCGLNGFRFYILWLQSSNSNLNDAKRWLVHARHMTVVVSTQLKGRGQRGWKQASSF